MGKEYPARSFKSGNSVAIRIPAELAVEPGKDWTIMRNEDGKLILDLRKKLPRKLNLSEIWGKGCGMKPLTPEERIIHPRPSAIEDGDDG